MILVSPFVVSPVDMSWFAVQQWVGELGSADSFLDNLDMFGVEMVTEGNAQHTITFMRQVGLNPAALHDVSESLENLGNWVCAMCASCGQEQLEQCDQEQLERSGQEQLEQCDQEQFEQCNQKQLEQCDQEQWSSVGDCNVDIDAVLAQSE